MYEQMWYMFQYADAFIALPGGLGTLEPLFNIASWEILKIDRKPLGFLNVNGFYDGLLTIFDHVVEAEFMTQEARQLIISSSNVKQLIDQMINLAPELGLPMRQVNQNP
ncbi:probable cytokinin riboside 5'-monophosphate phosphoribohydrolase LOGL8 [Gastrolobium bilobum]|uniref:probable cytokinin riboside 5'-monophosphate phosphoribohydrolase LOGL8 n=1 Tax=Gastrolobium bilobum TaxID=150636 RepID=UPI002AB0D2CB|nr:probable cytokinin riboside 5'-monophosphate phosphoribohydrolase LOGL8 [Gastrolobium bilobum]